jgi:hypothetical protein
MTDDSPRGDAAHAPAEALDAPEAAATASAAEVTSAAADADADAGEKPELDDVKRKFRDALDRKKQANAADAAGTGGKGKGKAQAAHGPASTRRSFRRKSG